jgi:sec-independent protein translocase protein TatC
MTDDPRPLADHLEEARRRVFIVLAAAALAALASYFFVDKLILSFVKITGPLVFLAPTEAFTAKIKLAMILGVFVSAPVILWQAWQFVGVALRPGERHWVRAMLPVSYFLFAAGAALAWFVVIPKGLLFLMSFASEALRPALSISACLEFALWLSLGMGVLFQLPIVIVALVSWGVVEYDALARHRRHAFLAILIAAAVITPGPDVFSQMMLGLPTYGLFEMSLLVSRFIRSRNNKKS